jgi:hypothetical protein
MKKKTNKKEIIMKKTFTEKLVIRGSMFGGAATAALVNKDLWKQAIKNALVTVGCVSLGVGLVGAIVIDPTDDQEVEEE